MKNTNNPSQITMTVLVTALTSAGAIALWLYFNPNHPGYKGNPLDVSTVFIPVAIFIGLFLLISKYISTQRRIYLRQRELEKLVGQLTDQLDAEKVKIETLQSRTEQINRQLQLSVSHSNLITQQAMESNRAKSDFLANMSYQIRTPMNAIIGFSEMLTEESLDQEQKRQVRIIQDSSRNLLQLINDILDFSKIEAGRLDVDIKDVAVESIISAVELLMKPAAIEKKLQFEIIRIDPLPKFIRTDSTRLKQCILNLVGNAVKFTEKGFVNVRISSEKQDDKAFVRFDVEDSGIGIAGDKLDSAFEPFAQVDTSGETPPLGGTGLGLTISKHIAELLGGKITVRSVREKGSTFSLFVPAAIETKNYENGKNNPAAKTPVKINDNLNIRFTGSVLVVEDSPTNQVLIDLLLKKTGLEVDIVENGLLAVQKAALKKYDVILMDIQMPVMNGYEATKQLRKDGIKTPVIALTACAMEGDEEKCFAAGCSDYLTKPVDRKKLFETLIKYLAADSVKLSSDTILTNTENKKETTMQNKEENSAPVEVSELEIDWQLLMERIGDEALIDEIVPVFLKDNSERMLLLTEAVKKTDTREVKFYAHSIKGASGILGAAKISELAKQLENAAREEQTDKYLPLYEQIKTRFDSLLALLNNKDWKQIVKNAAKSQTSQKA
jgi:signal transduction histidine kinase/DNA-binding response OmpR family regulator